MKCIKCSATIGILDKCHACDCIQSEEKVWSSVSNYDQDIEMTIEQAEYAYHSGQCYEDAKEIVEEIDCSSIDKEILKKELKEYGAWEDEELTDHTENLVKWIWLCASDIIERRI